MRFHISAFPIDKTFQKAIKIYDSGYLNRLDVGITIESLTEHGYTKCNSFVEDIGGTLQFTMHFTKKA